VPKKKVLITQAIHESGVKLLEGDYEVKVADDCSVEGLKREVKDAYGIIARTALVPKEVIDAAPNLQVIGRHGVGVDNIDVAAATARGIPVVFTPNANALSVAEWTLTAIGALAKGLLIYDKATREGQWERRNEYVIVDLDQKTLGLVGIGRIGSLVATKAQAAYNMKVLAYDPYIPPERAQGLGVTLCNSLEEVLREADFVSLHLPLTPESRGLIGKEELALLKPTSFLINAARGGIVDEDALVEALRAGKLAGAALDVFAQEPPPEDHPLWDLDNVIVAPHIAALTIECVIRMATTVARNVRDVLEGRRPEFVVNPEVYNK
jgi:D-3-phosphoglycerate dehydrogenase